MVQWKITPEEVNYRLGRVNAALKTNLPPKIRPRMIELKAKLEMIQELQILYPSKPTKGLDS